MTRSLRFAGRAALAAAALLVLQAQVCTPTPPTSPPITVTGVLTCNGSPAADIPVIPNGGGLAMTDATGAFTLTGVFPATPNGVRVLYEGTIPLSPTLTAPLKIGDDVMVPRHDDIAATPTVTGATVAFGTLAIPGTDCRLWAAGVRSLRHFFGVMGTAPPGGGGLHFKRWSAVPLSVGAPHTLFDLIVAPTDLITNQPATVFHEFGHRIRHAADGNHVHWDWDNTRFIYARKHGGAEITNRGYTFNEGWANYWQAVVLSGPPPGPGSPCAADGLAADPAATDFNETSVGQRLLALSCPVGPAFMVNVLIDNPGVIHTLPQFETRYCAAVGTNQFCAGGVPVRTFPSCPPGWNDDGLSCRFITDLAKPWFYRGPGQVPPIGGSCAPGTEPWLGLCYPVCTAPFVAGGTNCVQSCPSGFTDLAATCHRDPLSDPLQNVFGDDPVAPP